MPAGVRALNLTALWAEAEGMADLTCTRCENTGAAIEGRIPFVGELKDRVQAEVCDSCFRQWLELQIRLINEYRLHMGESEHREFLFRCARQFFKFEPVPDEAAPK